MRISLGIDVGGTGIKGALVDVDKGVLTSERIKIPTPKGAKPDDVANAVKELVEKFEWTGKPIGVGFPAAIRNKIVLTATNIDKSWIGMDIEKFLSKQTGSPATLLNDADAAGLAEVRFGAGKEVEGTLILLTLGTGIGSAIFRSGDLLHNTEMGQLKFKGAIAEKSVSNAARIALDLSWDEYGKQLNAFLKHVHKLFYPELIILGGGISKKFHKYSDAFSKDLNVIPATMLNNAGIIGAAASLDS